MAGLVLHDKKKTKINLLFTRISPLRRKKQKNSPQSQEEIVTADQLMSQDNQ